MTRPVRLLVTGFGPFPRVRDNPSGALALRLARTRRLRLHGIAVTARVLETRYDVAGTTADLIHDTRPDAILMLGVAARARTLRVEERGVARARAIAPDAGGAVLDHLLTAFSSREPASASLENAPAASAPSPKQPRPAIVHTILPIAPAVAALRSARLPARASNDAGRYICNAAYYEALRVAGRAIPVLFVHIPLPRPAAGHLPRHRNSERRPSLAEMELGLTTIALRLARRRS